MKNINLENSYNTGQTKEKKGLRLLNSQILCKCIIFYKMFRCFDMQNNVKYTVAYNMFLWNVVQNV